jgi:hypothetical protein
VSIFRSDDYHPSDSIRIDPLERKHNEEDDAGEKRKKKVAYKGRSWAEGEEDLPVQPQGQLALEAGEKKGMGVYADQAQLEKAEKLLARFPTLEEKVGQLCFLQTEACYDLEVQQEVEKLIQVWRLGGLLFVRGEFRRQSYLIERYQEVSSVPLMIGNDFLHGLSFYFQGEIPMASIEKMDERRSSDLGKAVVFQNRRLGVHFQFDRELKQENEKGTVILNDAQARSFRNGIREAHGIVGKEKVRNNKVSHSAKMNQAAPFLTTLVGAEHVQEAFGLRTINFLDLTGPGQDDLLEQKIEEALQNPFEAILLKERSSQVLQLFTQSVRNGKIKESDLDRKLVKVLLLKMLLFPQALL